MLLVHGSVSNQQSNWEFVKPLFARRFTVYAIARRGGNNRRNCRSQRGG